MRPFFGQNLGLLKLFHKNFDFSNILYQNLLFGAGTELYGWSRSRHFLPGAGKKLSGARAEEKWLGSATLLSLCLLFSYIDHNDWPPRSVLAAVTVDHQVHVITHRRHWLPCSRAKISHLLKDLINLNLEMKLYFGFQKSQE